MACQALDKVGSMPRTEAALKGVEKCFISFHQSAVAACASLSDIGILEEDELGTWSEKKEEESTPSRADSFDLKGCTTALEEYHRALVGLGNVIEGPSVTAGKKGKSQPVSSKFYTDARALYKDYSAEWQRMNANRLTAIALTVTEPEKTDKK